MIDRRPEIVMIFTDEPFNVAIGGHVTGGEHREFVMASGEMTDAQFLEFNRRWIGALLPYLVDAAFLERSSIGEVCRSSTQQQSSLGCRRSI